MRFGLLSRLGAEIGCAGVSGWYPDVIHAHNWQAGLTPVYARQNRAATPCVLTIHNIAFRGNFPASEMGVLELAPKASPPTGSRIMGISAS